MRKYKKKSVIKKLQDKAETLAKMYVLDRDHHLCQVRLHFPNIKIAHSPIVQVDHCFSRSIKELFLDVANLTTICSTCNASKGSNKIAVTKRDAITVAVHEIVKRREGEDAYNRLLEIASGQSAFVAWRNIAYLEEQIQILEEMIDES